MTTAPQLYEYGIHTEESDIRAHVSVVNRTVYVFPTKAGVSAIEKHHPPLRSASQPGVEGITAMGWLVRPDWIGQLRRVRYHSWPHWGGFKEDLSTSKKGAFAVQCTTDLLKLGRFPLWVQASESSDCAIQIAGTDIVVCCRKRIQVKCDFHGGDRPAGTGNLFLQQAERNPLGLY